MSGPHADGGGSIAAQKLSGVASTGANAQIWQVQIPAQGIPEPAEVSVERMWWVPRRPSRVFVGRQAALERLAASLETAGAGVVGQSVAGLGGVGKSELALHHAFACRDQYTCVWWVTADSQASMMAGFARLARRIAPATVLLPSEAAAQWAMGWLQQHRGWLVVLDNVDDPADVEEFLAGADGGHVLVTTRRDVDWASLGLTPIRLGVLAYDDAVALLLERTGQADADAAGRVAQMLGFLPLALEQAGAYVAHHQVTLDDYTQMLRAQPAEMFLAVAPGVDDERAISRVWGITFNALMEADPVAVEVLNVLAWLGPDELPRDLVTGLTGGDKMVANRVLGLLASHSMVTLTSESVGIHRLVQAVLRMADQAPAGSALSAAAQRAVQLLNEVAPADPDRDVAGWPRWWVLLPHIEALAQHVAGASTHSLGRLLNEAALFTASQGLYAETATLAERALAIAEATLGPQDPTVATCLGNLASSYRDLGRAGEAVPLERRALAIAEAALGPEHPDVATRLGNLAACYTDLGRVSEAVPLQQRALAISEAALGPEHPTVANRLGNLAASYRDLGRAGEAVPLQQRALAISEAALGPEHPTVANRLGNLAASYTDLGRVSEAVPLEQRALAIAEAALGPEHPEVANRLGNLAASYAELGRVSVAVPLEQRALAIAEAALGPEHPDVAIRLGNLAASYTELGRAGEAVPLQQRALAITEAALGPEHPDMAIRLGNLAVSYRDLGQVSEAVSLSAKAVRIAERHLTPGHPTTIALQEFLTALQSG